MATTQYIGARYVPVFADPAEWNDTRTYEPLTIVQHEGNSYTSKQYVPKGVDILNEDFWANTGNYNAQVEQYRQEVKTYDGRITVNADAISAETTRAKAAEKSNADAISAEATRAKAAEKSLQTNIDGVKNGGILQKIYFPIEFSLGATRAADLITNLMGVGYNDFSLIVDIKSGSYAITDEFIDAVYNTGCTVKNFTFHGDVDSGIDVYFDGVNNFLNKYAQRFNVTTIFAINEKNQFIENNDAAVAEKLKALPYKVGICFNTDQYYTVCNAVNTLAAIDYFGFNVYPSISYYGAKATDADIVDAIEKQMVKLNLIYAKSNAQKIITEIGCKPTFLAYKNTGDWAISGSWDINATKRFLAATINSNLFRSYEGIGIWYASWFTEYTSMYDFFKNEVINNG